MKSVNNAGIYGIPLSVLYFGASGEPQSRLLVSLIDGYSYDLTGGITLTAGGIDKDITLTPSGTGNLTTGNKLYVGRTTGQRRVEIAAVGYGNNQDNGLRIVTNQAVGAAGYISTDFTLKSDGGGNYRGAIDYLSTGGGVNTEILSWNNSFVKVVAGDLSIETAGKGLKVKSGSNAKKGTATLVNGVVTVTNSSILAGSQVIITRGAVNTSTAIGHVTVSKSAGASFTVTVRKSDTTTETGDQSSIEWLIVDEA
jgi:hypothetical protein